jgi:hypothetical protein
VHTRAAAGCRQSSRRPGWRHHNSLGVHPTHCADRPWSAKGDQALDPTVPQRQLASFNGKDVPDVALAPAANGPALTHIVGQHRVLHVRQVHQRAARAAVVKLPCVRSQSFSCADRRALPTQSQEAHLEQAQGHIEVGARFVSRGAHVVLRRKVVHAWRFTGAAYPAHPGQSVLEGPAIAAGKRQAVDAPAAHSAGQDAAQTVEVLAVVDHKRCHNVARNARLHGPRPLGLTQTDIAA